MSLRKEDGCKKDFYEKFLKVLKRPLQEESEEVRNARMAGEALKWELNALIGQIHKLDLLADDLDLSSFLKSRVEYPIERWVEQKAKPWLEDKLTVAFIGHYSVGKTTVINSLFNQKFPTTSNESTALPTYIYYGNNVDVVHVVDKNGKIQDLSNEEASLLDFDVSSQFPFARIFDYLVKECADNVLKELTFIDVPGLFSNKTEHSIQTMQIFNQTDIIVWCERIDRGFEKESIDILKEKAANKPIYLVLTYAEKVKDIAGLVKNFSDTAKREGLEIKGYFVFGETQELEQQFVKEFMRVAKTLSNEYEKFMPMAEIYGLAKAMVDMLSEAQRDIKKHISKLEKGRDDIINKYQHSQDLFNTEWNNVGTRLNNMISTFNNRCANAIWCGGAAGAISSDINRVVSSLNSMATAYGAINVADLVDIGNYSSTIAELEENSKVIDDIIKQFKNNILNLFER